MLVRRVFFFYEDHHDRSNLYVVIANIEHMIAGHPSQYKKDNDA